MIMSNIFVVDTQWEWICFSMLPLIDTKEKLVTCPSCGYTATSEDADVIYEEAFDVSFMRCAEMLEPLKLTTCELALVKALCIVNPGDFFFDNFVTIIGVILTVEKFHF